MSTLIIQIDYDTACISAGNIPDPLAIHFKIPSTHFIILENTIPHN